MRLKLVIMSVALLVIYIRLFTFGEQFLAPFKKYSKINTDKMHVVYDGGVWLTPAITLT